MQHIVKPGKLLVSIVGRHRGEAYVAVTKAAGARGGTIALGRGVADSRILQALSLADVHQEVVYTLMGQESEAIIAAVRQAAADAPKKFGGLAVVLSVPGMLVRVDGQGKDFKETDARSEQMESGYKLITVIVNQGFAEDVMAAARKAGAKGGTVLTARGTGTEEDVRFFGICLVPEKEMLYIVADNDRVDTIMDAINKVPHLCEPGGGIAYCMNVEQFIRLGAE